jgi:hypothetical protein
MLVNYLVVESQDMHAFGYNITCKTFLLSEFCNFNPQKDIQYEICSYNHTITLQRIK